MNRLLFLFVFFNVAYISFSQEKTRVVDRIYAGNSDFISVWNMCSDNNIAKQIVKTRNSFPKDAIKLGWDEGYDILDISFGGDYWSLVMDKDINVGKQRWFTCGYSELKSNIQKYWDEGYYIQDISYGDGVYAVVISETPPNGVGLQSWFTVNTVAEFEEKVDEYWERDYSVIELVYTDDDFWFVFMQKDANFTSQSWRGRNEFPIDAIEDQKNEGRLLTSLATNGEYWIGIFSGVEECYSQTFGDLELERPNKKPSSSGSGTGIAINSNGYIATNYHVIDGASNIIIKGVDGDLEKTYRAKVIVEDQRNDLAILKIEKWLGEIPYEISRSTLDLANQVYALGYPLTSLLGSDIKFTDGKIGATTGFENDPTYYQHSAPIQPGNSGGPLFSATGNLIAINTLRVNQDFAITEGIFFSVKARYLINLMEDKNISFPSSRGLDNYKIPQQVKIIKNFVYLIEVN